ncbi:hypothetical protein [Thermomonospora umbrina]|uniref:hypothetical protein n=1 Tax=Thermomonospora umbrina TaxID=111806 RepID=UPI0014773D2E|nr:hypothetical protein [Thermomonospora umbrina]
MTDHGEQESFIAYTAPAQTSLGTGMPTGRYATPSKPGKISHHSENGPENGPEIAG